MKREDFKKTKWRRDKRTGFEFTVARISLDDRDPDMKATIYADFGGSEVLPVLDIDFRDATLGIEHYGKYMRVPCEDVEIVKE
ncbi:hypothetical protein [Porphyromonas somerae]|uniref:hypothetical protein n=1 Tax=Porphyromonas somerae TaxID=322095 RepID=UPI002A81D590|nr:hypothetical protein [Porphyromonas somerae]MDD7274208.1 hypothetical protein [Treponema sp.]MDY3884816.1 hypothetical protein [Porphyromonas somerae]